MSSTESHVRHLLGQYDMLSVGITLGIFYLIFQVIASVHSVYWGPLSRFPGPKIRAFSIFPALHTLWYGLDNRDHLELHEKYGDIVRVAPNRLSVRGSAESWKAIHGFRKSGQPEVKKDPIFYGDSINKAPNLINAEYEDHSRQRKMISHAFSDKALKEQEPMLRSWAKKLKIFLEKNAATSEPIDMVRAYNYTTFDIMSELTFGEPLHMLDNSDYTPWVAAIFQSLKFGSRIQVVKSLSNFTAAILDDLMFRIPALREKQMDHWRYTAERVNRRLARTPSQPDLWSRILEKGGDPHKPGASLTLGEHQSNAGLFMIAGTETTATGVTYYLLQNPKYLKQVTEELRSNFSSIDEMHLDPLARLPILDAVLREGLRMYPPVPSGLGRLSPPGGMMIGDQFVPEGTCMYVHHLASYRSELRFKYPYEFRPERWLGDPEFKDDDQSAFEPFSFGPRNCLGKNLAWHELRLLFATVFTNFDLELCEESRNWVEQPVFILWEKGPLMCKLKPAVS